MRAAVSQQYGRGLRRVRGPPGGRGSPGRQSAGGGAEPVDVAIASGSLCPEVALRGRREGVGTLGDRRVYFNGAVPPFGSMAELSLIDPRTGVRRARRRGRCRALALASRADTRLAGPVVARPMQAGEHVFVLGASGAVGMLAVRRPGCSGRDASFAAADLRSGWRSLVSAGPTPRLRLDLGEEELTATIREAWRGSA